MSVDSLVERCKKGDPASQFELYRQYSKAMFNTALRIVGDRQQAEDMLQVAFVKIFRNLSSFRFESSLGSWMKRVVVNECISEVRKKRIWTVEAEDSVIAEPSEEFTSHDNSLKVEQIKGAMKQLPDGYRIVFSLYLIEGYDHAEISEILSISEATSKSQLSRAKDKVRKIIEANSN